MSVSTMKKSQACCMKQGVGQRHSATRPVGKAVETPAWSTLMAACPHSLQDCLQDHCTPPEGRAETETDLCVKSPDKRCSPFGAMSSAAQGGVLSPVASFLRLVYRSRFTKQSIYLHQERRLISLLHLVPPHKRLAGTRSPILGRVSFSQVAAFSV